MTQPNIAIVYETVPAGIVGTNVPLISSENEGSTVKKLRKKQVAIVMMRKAKKNYGIIKE